MAKDTGVSPCTYNTNIGECPNCQNQTGYLIEHAPKNTLVCAKCGHNREGNFVNSK